MGVWQCARFGNVQGFVTMFCLVGGLSAQHYWCTEMLYERDMLTCTVLYNALTLYSDLYLQVI